MNNVLLRHALLSNFKLTMSMTIILLILQNGQSLVSRRIHNGTSFCQKLDIGFHILINGKWIP